MERKDKAMGDGTKRIFISDIHMGNDESVAPRKPYVWFKNNASFLERFLDEQLNAPDVKEVIILGDLFDEWIIPSDYDPIKSFDSICSNTTNKPVIEKMNALAAEFRLVYVPGNHDMAMDIIGIPAIEQFMKDTFPGIIFICDDKMPLGRYEDGILVAEHGNRYCLFNAPDSWTNPSCFLPLGYFISRMVAYKVSTTGHDEDPRHIFIDLLKEWWKGAPDFIEDLFQAIADDCGLTAESIIKLDGIPDCGKGMTVADIGKQFRRLYSDWGKVPGAENVSAPEAVDGELEDLYKAATSTYFRPGSPYKVVIFGHTHIPRMGNIYENSSYPDFVVVPDENACLTIYANSGTWVDQAKKGCTYVETEEVQTQDEKRLYVRVKRYPGNAIISGYEGFVKL
jgi:UDP-2,3-diacylglucosamine pyrophosphatase LpxH